MAKQARTPPDAADPERPNEMGRKLRMRRAIKGLSLQEVAERAEISVGLLSQIERGVTTPSLKSLRQICAALAMPIGWLFDLAEAEHDDVVVRASARRTLDLGPKGMRKELLSPDAVPGIQMIRIVIRPGGASGEPYNNPAGTKCGTVLAGTLGLEVDGQDYILETGDSFAFAATQMHRFWCVGDQTVDLIWVVTPAIY
ncbi:helix-turn-helix domain-containing protein [Chelatococcus reniformis]|uniref:XRE family transcriptional regulator n=1 Tax=Chelatococcus reniformis TaxID=1494448 RepID=A0A916TXD2_9HYPH|nr:XRE family transcriptional regulator [Chelatococcus reniformis]GGC46141.1 XRE family transcriptional regulator [Chelatococcus reniformis]